MSNGEDIQGGIYSVRRCKQTLNVEGVLQELSPKGLFIYVYDLFEDEATADNFIKMVEKWSCRR